MSALSSVATSSTLPLLAHTASRTRLLSGALVFAGLSAFGSSAVLLILQQISFRLLAPLIGSSLETWSAIIGTFLLGIAAGNVVGGWVADRGNPVQGMLWSWRASCLAIFCLPSLSAWLIQAPWIQSLPLGVQIALAAGVVCFPVAFLLSLLTPGAVRISMHGAEDAGRVAGYLFALGTVGSLVGNYLTGFVLIPLFDIHAIVYCSAFACLPFCLAWKIAPSPRAPVATSAAATITPASDDIHFREHWYQAVALVFVASFVSGTLESAAFRMLAPLVGFSLFLSTGVVGVVLAGMSLGNYWGGRWADTPNPATRLRYALGCAALFTWLIVPLLRSWSAQPMLDALPTIPKILFWSFVLFFAPSFFLGMISPLVIRLTVNQLHRSGAETGRLYAWSTLGCIVGILGTGWCFIEWLGVYRLTALCAAILLPLPFLLCSRVKSGSTGIRYGLAAYAVGALLYLSLIGSPYDLETRYFSIKVLDGEREGRAIKRLALDHLVHSEVDLQDPHWLGYKHEEIQGEFTRHFAKRYAQPEVLMIGGGGYTFPRWMEHQPDLQQVRLQVVEIDPGVTEVAHRSMGFSRQSRVISHHLDGRQFVRKSSQGAYHLLIQDAVNDYSVPYHLMTREYNQLIQRSLAPQGVYLLTVIDSITEGPFLRAALRTMQQDFPEVRVLSPTGDWHNPIRSVYVLAGFTTAESCEEVLSALDSSLVHVLPPTQAAALLARDGTNGLILTDRHAPVDNLMAGAYLTSGGK